MALPSRESLRRSELVFRAKVTRIGASTQPELPASDATVVALVEEVYQAPEVLGLLAGRAITLVLHDTRPLHAGQVALFLAKGWLYGESIAAIEVAREIEPMDPADLRGHVNTEAQIARDEALSERIAHATLIVSGTVLETRPVEIPRPVAASEHMPLWAEAVIGVTTVEQGDSPGEQVAVLYPESRDIKWYRAPKFRTGQTGVWLLRSQHIQELDRQALTALNLLDFHPAEALERIRALIRRVR
jgi:hypothetical protein